MRLPSTILVVALLTVGCTPLPQTSSGADYLAGYDPVKSRPEVSVTRTTQRVGKDLAVVEDRVERLSTDDLVRDAAAIEPLLRLPARVGLARIDGGRLTTIPRGEAAAWEDIARRHAAFGSFAPIDPFLADYTMRLVVPQDRRAHRRDVSDVLTRIRLGAGRQHMDAVLIYEVGSRRGERAGVKGLRPVTVLGDAPLPAERIAKEGTARAILMDVRNGYPYGVASASVDLEGFEQSFWAPGADDPDALKAKAAISRALGTEIEALIAGLVRQMSTKLAAAK